MAFQFHACFGDDGSAALEAGDRTVVNTRAIVKPLEKVEEVGRLVGGDGADRGGGGEAIWRVLQIVDRGIEAVEAAGGDGVVRRADGGEDREEEGLDAEGVSKGGEPLHSEVKDDEVGPEVAEKGLYLGLGEVDGELEELGRSRGHVEGAGGVGREARDLREVERYDSNEMVGGQEVGDAGNVAGDGEEADPDGGAAGGGEISGKLEEGADVAKGWPGEEQHMEGAIRCRARHGCLDARPVLGCNGFY